MSEWDKLCNQFEENWIAPYPNAHALILGWNQVKAEGDLNLKEKRSLLTYGGMMRTENARLEQKLEAMGYHYMAYTCGDIDKLEFANEILELLGE